MTSGNLDLFKMALGLEDPWKVTRTDFNPEGGRLDLYLDFPRGARFSCPVDGGQPGSAQLDHPGPGAVFGRR